VKRTFIGLGSNQADPVRQLQSACIAIGSLPESRMLARSPLYRSKPLGPADQPDYVNAVVALETHLAPLALLASLQAIELAQGRTRDGQRWGPRTLDLDILLYGDEQIDLPELQVPHYHMHARPFVLYPLADIAAGLTMPNGVALSEMLLDCPLEGIERMAPQPGNGVEPW
jgi:2-amino-4-hydroxy-6-hydroxymethyldihydropteridine diphosphokinase